MIPAPVAGIPALAQATGSLQASARRPQDAAARWETGLAWRPETCFTAAGYGPCDPDPDVPGEGGADLGANYFYPVGFRVRDICSIVGGELDSDRVRRQAEATTSFQGAKELWTGALSTANPVTIGADAPYVNPFLADASAVTITSAATTLARKLGDLEEVAMAAALGQQVFVHLPPKYVLALGAELIQVGHVLYTPLGNVVVADAGYPGSGPAAPSDTDWAFATGPVVFRASPIEIIANLAQTLNRRTNKQEIFADRMVVATFDPCIHFALKLGSV